MLKSSFCKLINEFCLILLSDAAKERNYNGSSLPYVGLVLEHYQDNGGALSWALQHESVVLRVSAQNKLGVRHLLIEARKFWTIAACYALSCDLGVNLTIDEALDRISADELIEFVHHKDLGKLTALNWLRAEEVELRDPADTLGGAEPCPRSPQSAEAPIPGVSSGASHSSSDTMGDTVSKNRADGCGVVQRCTYSVSDTAYRSETFSVSSREMWPFTNIPKGGDMPVFSGAGAEGGAATPLRFKPGQSIEVLVGASDPEDIASSWQPGDPVPKRFFSLYGIGARSSSIDLDKVCRVTLHDGGTMVAAYFWDGTEWCSGSIPPQRAFFVFDLCLAWFNRSRYLNPLGNKKGRGGKTAPPAG